MLGFSKFLVNSLKLCNNGARLALPKYSQFLRGMETFAPKWENDLSSALKKAKELNKPVMLVAYRPWCTYCQYLSRQIESSNQLKQMEPFFVMTQINEDDTHLENKFAPDGGVKYVPRVLFLTPDGEVMKNIRNHKSDKDGTLYVYNEVDEIMDSMNEVVNKYFTVSSKDDKRKDHSHSKNHSKRNRKDRKKGDRKRKGKRTEKIRMTNATKCTRRKK